MVKRDRGASAVDSEEDAIAARLAVLGEQFMSQFDDYDPKAEARKRRQAKLELQDSIKNGAIAPVLPDERQSSHSQATSSGMQQGQPAAQIKAARSRQHGGSEIDNLFAAAKPIVKAAAEQRAASAAKTRAVPQTQAMMIDLRREKKLFMSSKAGRVHEVPHQKVSKPTSSTEDLNFGSLTSGQRQQLALEVERLGGAALDKKGAKAHKARMLERLGAKADKAPRTKAAIGKGVAAAQVVREARALEEAIATGMVRSKGTGKKKKALKSKSYDKGLQELSGGSFRNGVLRLKGPVKAHTGVRPSALKMPKGF